MSCWSHPDKPWCALYISLNKFGVAAYNTSAYCNTNPPLSIPFFYTHTHTHTTPLILNFTNPCLTKKSFRFPVKFSENPVGVNMNLKLILWNNSLLSYHYHNVLNNSITSSVSKTFSHVLKVCFLLQSAFFLGCSFMVVKFTCIFTQNWTGTLEEGCFHLFFYQSLHVDYKCELWPGRRH